MAKKYNPKPWREQGEPLVSRSQIDALTRKLKAQELQETAEALSLLVNLCKKKQAREWVLEEAGDEWEKSLFLQLLHNESPKVRKNTARLLGELYQSKGSESEPTALKAAKKLRSLLETEPIQMIRPSYILAIGAMGCGTLLTDYQTPEGTDPKHAAAEKEALRKALPPEPAAPHEWIGYPAGRNLILVTATGRKHRRLTAEKNGGLRPEDAAPLLSDRTWQEILVPLKGSEEVVPLLQGCLKGEDPYRYRLELRTSARDRGRRIRELMSQIEQTASSQLLINDPSHYEVEIRVEEKAAGVRKEKTRRGTASSLRNSVQEVGEPKLVSWYLKISSAPDHRFDYRKRAIPASIHPATAALIMQLAKPYRENSEKPARVLDPCCGSGTLLIERALMGGADLTGIDISRAALEAAAENLKEAASIYQQRDPLSWRLHRSDLCRWMPEEGRLFDEVYANLPFGIRVGDHRQNEALYAALIERLPQWLRPGGLAVLYTMEGRLLEQCLKQAPMLQLVKTQRLYAGGLEPRLFILKRQ